MVDIHIIIVNYNVCDLLRRCLQTVFASEGDFTYDVCVVDNNSPDGSVAMVRKAFPQVKVVANERNVGYPAANNQGIRALGFDPDGGPANARYTLLLNPDTEVPPKTLVELIAFMDANEDVGVVGPRLMLPDGQLDHACRRGFPTPLASFYYMFGLGRLFPGSARFTQYDLRHLDIDKQADIDSVTGAFMLIRTAAIERVGLMDERFWMYGEDLDWCKRIKDAGWRVVYNPAVSALHVKAASSQQNPRARYEFYRAMPIFYYKHYRRQTPLWLHLVVLAGIGVKGGRPVWKDILAGPAILESNAMPS